MIAWLEEEGVWADVVKLMTHGVVVRYMHRGMEYEVMLDREDVKLYDDDDEEVEG